MIEPITLEAAWYVSARMRAADAREILCQIWHRDVEAVARRATAQNAVGYACWREGRPVAVGGVTLRAPGVGVAWLWATDEWPRVVIESTRAARRVFTALELTGTYRVEAYTHVEHVEAHAWLAALGFEVEAERLRAYGGPGEDFVLMARVREPAASVDLDEQREAA